MKKMIFGLGLAFLANSAFAACTDISREIESSLKSVAAANADGVIDNSAPRATMRNAKMTAELAQVQVLVTQMQALKCTISQEPYIYTKYSQSAYGCALAPSKEKCDQSSWESLIKSPQ